MRIRTIRFCFICLVFSATAAAADDQAPFQLVGPDDSGSIKVTRATGSIRYDLQLKSTVDTKGVTVLVSPFISPDSSEISAQWTINGQPGKNAVVDLAAGDSAIVEISANLPMTGDYSTFVSVKSQGKPMWLKSLVVTRTRVAAPLEVSGIETARGDEDNVNFWFTLTENSGRTLMLFAPELKSLALIQAEKKNVQPSGIRITFTDSSGGALGDDLKLPGGKPIRLGVRIQGLSSGEYAGAIR